MKTYETVEEEYKDQFLEMKKSLSIIVVFVNLGMVIISYLSGEWAILIGSIISSFFIYFITCTIIDNIMRFFISKCKKDS